MTRELPKKGYVILDRNSLLFLLIRTRQSLLVQSLLRRVEL